MKLRCDRGALVDKLAVLSRGVSARMALPVLSGILLQASEDRLDLYSTDMEISIKASMPVTVDEPGDVVIPARLFSDVVRNLVGDEVRVESGSADGGVVQVTAGKARFSLNSWAASDFPQMSTFDVQGGFAVPREPFVETLGKVARAASRDETRPILTGVLVMIGGNSLRMVATDSYRLSVKQSVVEGGPSEEVQAIVPVKALAEVARLAAAADRPAIDVALTENQALFGFGEVFIATRLIDGVFPNYKQLLPDSYDHEFELDKNELLGVARRMGLLAQKNAPLRLKFAPADEEGPARLVVRAVTQDVGQAEEQLEIEYTGEVFEIGFNHAYLIDGVEAVDGDRIRLRLTSPLRPGLISGAGAEDGPDEFVYLIMPIRLSS
jgi:DNA polymerase-3 subunit beta